MSEESPIIKKIYPLISELDTIQNNITCNEEGCNKIFKTPANLTMHLQKHHKKERLAKSDNSIKQFHCPNSTCLYNNKQFFSKIKYLKQHYLKVHAEKKFMCKECNKGFSTESVLNKHMEICGVPFICSECLSSYGSYEALLTHSRRKKHKITKKTVINSSQNKEERPILPKNQFILPKQTINLIPVVLNMKNDCLLVDKEVQTESKYKTPLKRRSTQQTQTVSRKKSRISAETQTTGDCILKRAIQEAKIEVNEQKKCTKTQTNSWESNLPKQIELNFMENESNLNIFEDSSCNCQTQTDVIFQDEFLQSTVFTSHIETQTNDEPSLDLSSNMYTQTCEDALLSELEFTNIQTQTNWPDYDMFVSTETQTLLTHNTRSVLDLALNAREISHMETQTDIEFKQLLEEINA